MLKYAADSYVFNICQPQILPCQRIPSPENKLQNADGQDMMNETKGKKLQQVFLPFRL